jgi:hypothetical protein
MSVFTPPSDGLYELPRIQVLFRKQGESKFVNLGDTDAFTWTPNLTEIERYGKDSSTRVLRRTDVIQKDATIGMTLYQMTDTARGMLLMAEPDAYLAQDAVADGDVTFTNPAAGDIYSLGVRDVTLTSVTDGTTPTPVAYVVNVNYKVDRRTGMIEILSVPDGADTDLVIAYTAPAILETAKRWSGGPMSNNGVRGTLFLRGQGDIGENHEAWFWDVKLRPNGDVAFQGEDDYASIQLTGRCYADGTQPTGYEYGRMTSIPKTALA